MLAEMKYGAVSGGRKQQRGDTVTQPASQHCRPDAFFITHVQSSLDKSVHSSLELELDQQEV